MIVDIYIEGQKIDLFEDETISVTQGVQDVKDISKLFADFSQSFNVPASKRNNSIFKNYYNQDIDNGFDARTRKAGLINISTLPFKTGKIQLNGSKLENNKPSSYNLTFFGDAIKVKDLIGDDKLNELTWLSNFDHDYSDTSVKTGLTSGLDFVVNGISYPRAVIYPLISYQRQFFYNSNTSDTTSTDNLVNIAYYAGRNDGVRFSDLKPAIKLSVIVEAIQQQYGFNFVGGFFESQLFNDIYINLNNSTDALSNGLIVVEETTSVTPEESSASNDIVRYYATITPEAGYTNVGYKIKITMNGEVKHESSNFLYGTNTKDGIIDSPTGEAIVKLEIITEVDFVFDAYTDLVYDRSFFPEISLSDYPHNFTGLSIDLYTVILTQLKDIKTYKFLTNLFKTFNLIVTQSGDDILVEDLQTWYSNGKILDITPYLDTKTKGVDKGVIFNEMEFTFEESDQLLADVFKQSNNRVFGNEELTLYTDETETKKLDGKTLSIESIFENPMFERLLDLDTNAQTTIQYCPYFDRDLKSISGNPFMLYGLSTDVSSNPIGYKNISSYEEINTSIIMPSHTQIINFDSFSLNFSSEINEYTNNLNKDTIYSRFYSDYINDVFSFKRRNYNYKAILPLSILNGLKLNDRLVIENTRYIINKITSNLTIREDSLELINDIYDAPLASDSLNNSLLRPAFARYPNSQVTDSIQYIGVDGGDTSVVDIGNGDEWVTINSFGKTAVSTINFTLDANLTTRSRVIQIKVTDGLKNPIFNIKQEA